METWTIFEGRRAEHKQYAIGCDNCGAYGPSDLGQSGAEEAWNTRRLMDRALAVIAELEGKIAH